MLVFTFFEQLGAVHLEQVDLLPHVVDVTVDHDKSFLVLILTFDVDLDEQLPSLLLLCQVDSMLPC